MAKEGGLARNNWETFPVFKISEGEWEKIEELYGITYDIGAIIPRDVVEIKINDQVLHKGYAMFIRSFKLKGMTMVENKNIVHENAHIYINDFMEDLDEDNSLITGEVFAMLWTEFLEGVVSTIGFYDDVRAPLINTLNVYEKIGKKATVRLFESDFNLIEKLGEDENLLNGLTLLTALYGGDKAVTLLKESENSLLKEAKSVSHKAKEKGVIKRHLASEFNIGENFAEKWTRWKRPQSVYEIINADRDRTLLRVISAYKFIFSHQPRGIVNYEKGARRLENFAKRKTLTSLSKGLEWFNYYLLLNLI